jgi:uncharacterized phage protein gp47/JayE
MSNPFLRNFDDILDELLIDYKNLSPSPDVSEGSIVFIKAACLASMLWGLYRYQDFISLQPFPDTCDTENLNHWGSIYGITRNTGESDHDYAGRIIGYLQAPPEGGTAEDYMTWALAITTTINVQENFSPAAVNVVANTITLSVDWDTDTSTFPNIVTFSTNGTLPSGLSLGTQYYIIHDGTYTIQVSTSRGGSAVALGSQGTGTHTIVPAVTPLYHAQAAYVITPNSPSSPTIPGTVSVVIDPNLIDNSLDATDKTTFLFSNGMTTLLNAIHAYIETLRPVTANETNVLPTSTLSTAIEIQVLPSTLSSTQLSTMTSDITAFVNSLIPGQILYISKLEAICINDGAVGAEVISPIFDVVPTNYQTVILSGNPNIHV